jgi:DNA-binding CsgD family transcriptional regulator
MKKPKILRCNLQLGFKELRNEQVLLYPDLTLSDQKIACLHRLNMSRTDIAEIMGVSADSLRKTNQRMRSRLGILDQSQVIAYLFKIPMHSEDVTLSQGEN